MSEREIRRRRCNWDDVVLVCRKCSKRARGGFGPGGGTRLAKALKKTLKLEKGRRARVKIVEVGCLGLCPKNAVTVVSSRRPRTMFAAPLGAPAEEVAAALGVDAKAARGDSS